MQFPQFIISAAVRQICILERLSERSAIMVSSTVLTKVTTGGMTAIHSSLPINDSLVNGLINIVVPNT